MAKAVIITLGCRVNCADSALLTDRLTKKGFAVAEKIDAANPPDLVVVNTCAVTSEAVSKSRQAVRRARKIAPLARIVALGCAAVPDEKNLLAAGADLVRDNFYKVQAPDFTDTPTAFSATFRENAVSQFPFRTRSFIKIQEGCNNFCSYCIVPLVRGREKSRAFAEVLDDCRHAIAAGFPEIVLSGVNLCAYTDDGRKLADLVAEVANLPGDFRVRIGSAEPRFDQLKLLDVMANEAKICRFLHLSLQHGSDVILRSMHRHYSAAQYREFCLAAREKIPDLHLGTDVIVGFPGETEELFEESLDFVEKLRFANIHQFIYSPRPGTAAAKFPEQVPGCVAKMRAQKLRRVALASAENFRQSQIGKRFGVIFEQDDGRILRGWSDHYLEVAVPSQSFPRGKIVEIEATEKNLRSVGDLPK